jgi:hypothetical protein
MFLYLNCTAKPVSDIHIWKNVCRKYFCLNSFILRHKKTLLIQQAGTGKLPGYRTSRLSCSTYSNLSSYLLFLLLLIQYHKWLQLVCLFVCIVDNWRSNLVWISCPSLIAVLLNISCFCVKLKFMCYLLPATPCLLIFECSEALIIVQTNSNMYLIQQNGIGNHNTMDCGKKSCVSHWLLQIMDGVKQYQLMKTYVFSTERKCMVAM